MDEGIEEAGQGWEFNVNLAVRKLKWRKR